MSVSIVQIINKHTLPFFAENGVNVRTPYEVFQAGIPKKSPVPGLSQPEQRGTTAQRRPDLGETGVRWLLYLYTQLVFVPNDLTAPSVP